MCVDVHDNSSCASIVVNAKKNRPGTLPQCRKNIYLHNVLVLM